MKHASRFIIALTFMVALGLGAHAAQTGDAAPALPAVPAAPAWIPPVKPAPEVVPEGEAPAAEAPAAEAPAEGAEQPAPAPPAGKPLTALHQVQIQVWISEINETGLRDIGTQLRYTRTVNGVDQGGTVQQVDVYNPVDGSFQATLPRPDSTLFPNQFSHADENGNIAGTQVESGAGLDATIINSHYGTLDTVFRGIEQKSDLDLISKPEILVINNGTAEIHAGDQVPFQTVSYDSSGYPKLNVAWQKVGVNLNLQPLIMPDDSVQISITELSVSDAREENIQGIDYELPVFATRSQSGVVLVPNAQPLVIGGLSNRRVEKIDQRVPILGRLPLIGIPFRGRTSQARNAELLVFVRPTIVDLRNLSGNAVNALNFWRERKWQNADRIANEIQVMQDEL